jgi:hypothetical protein
MACVRVVVLRRLLVRLLPRCSLQICDRLRGDGGDTGAQPCGATAHCRVGTGGRTRATESLLCCAAAAGRLCVVGAANERCCGCCRVLHAELRTERKAAEHCVATHDACADATAQLTRYAPTFLFHDVAMPKAKCGESLCFHGDVGWERGTESLVECVWVLCVYSVSILFRESQCIETSLPREE